MEGEHQQIHMGEILKGRGSKEKVPSKTYHFEDPDSDRGRDGERDTFSVYYDEGRSSYLKDGEMIDQKEAKHLLENHPSLEKEDKERLGLE